MTREKELAVLAQLGATRKFMASLNARTLGKIPLDPARVNEVFLLTSEVATSLGFLLIMSWQKFLDLSCNRHRNWQHISKEALVTVNLPARQSPVKISEAKLVGILGELGASIGCLADEDIRESSFTLEELGELISLAVSINVQLAWFLEVHLCRRLNRA